MKLQRQRPVNVPDNRPRLSSDWPRAVILAGKPGDGFDRNGFSSWPKVACRANRGCNARVAFVQGYDSRYHVVRMRTGFQEFTLTGVPGKLWALTNHVQRQWEYVKTRGVSWERFDPKMRHPVLQRLSSKYTTLVSAGPMHTVQATDDHPSCTFYFLCPKCNHVSLAEVPPECGPGRSCEVHSLGEVVGLSDLGEFCHH